MTTASLLPFVSVIIPTRNEERYLAVCLDSIARGSYPPDRMEILVVDGMSDDGTREVLAKLSDQETIRVLENPARVVPNAMNIGIAAARGEIIVRADAHAVYPTDYVLTLVTWLRKLNAENVGCSFNTRPASNKPEARAIAAILSHPFGVGNSKYRYRCPKEPVEVETVPFGCYRREIFARIGLYDEALTRNQDDELNARLRAAGGHIFLVPDLQVDYVARPSLGKMAAMLFQYGYFKPLVALKLGRPATWRQLGPPVFTAALLVLPVFFWLLPWSLALWIFTVTSHTVVNIAVSTWLARHDRRIFPYLLSGFLLAHLAYGIGYFKGIVAFGICRAHLHKTQREISLSR